MAGAAAKRSFFFVRALSVGRRPLRIAIRHRRTDLDTRGSGLKVARIGYTGIVARGVESNRIPAG